MVSDVVNTSTAASPLLERVRQTFRAHSYSRNTEEVYLRWMRHFILFHGKRHPRELGEREVTAFLAHLADDGASAAAQNQAVSAILFLCEVALGERRPWMDGIARVQRPVTRPVVLSREEVAAVLRRLRGPVRLMASLMYGAGLRLLECAELRVRDVNFAQAELIVRDGNGVSERVTILPVALSGSLRNHVARVKAQHGAALAAGRGTVAVPIGVRAKYPTAPQEWAWQWVFPATRFYVDRETGERRRHHLHESLLQRAVKNAVRTAGVARPATCHSLRHSFAMHLLESGYSVRTIQELLGHSKMSTTMIYAQMLTQSSRRVRSPLDFLGHSTESG
jgi:integron integrase